MGVCNVSDNKRRKSIHVNTRSNLIDINSKYILQKIFDNIINLKKLEIIKYNKKIQKRLNLNINDYKKYADYSPIEIELKLVDNKYDKFINISNEEKKYYHIYFDNSNEEIKKNFLKEKEKVKMIKIIIDYQVKLFE